MCFPVAYFLMPYLSVVPSTSAPPESKTGAAIWIAICGLLMIQVTGRTFALPTQTILVNNCSPHPSVLGTVHGLGLSVSSAARTIGPMIAGVVYGYGLDHGVIGMAFWALSGIAVVGCFTSLLVHEGDGHEIWLEGDEEPEMTETER
jgi:predicted MFS family arabinose efflux permease